MKLKRCMIMGITACLIIESMSGCSSKENGNSQSNQKEQTIQTNQTEEEISENEDVKNEEELQPTTVTVDYAEAFQSIQGCAVILNSENNTYTFYNEDKCRTRVSPNSSFKVISALIGIHNQVITSEDSKMEYDGMNYPVDAWNADLRLEDAFRSSCIWYFRKVIDEVGQQTVVEEVIQNGKKHYCYTSKADFDCGIRNSASSTETENGSVLPSVNRPRRTVIKL